MKDREKIKIYIAAHKKVDFPKDKIYVPIQVGAHNKEKFTKVTDDIGDNISSKNLNFCELTATYWIWKNDNSDIVGLTHYRRYFFKDNKNTFDHLLDRNTILDYLKKYDLIVPRKNYLLRCKNLRSSYQKFHHIEDWEICKKVIAEKYPNYLDSFEWMEKSRKFYACNMFISSKASFDSYYEWLFDILFEVEKRVDISNYDSYNKRIFGFLSERLFNVWIHHNNKTVKEVPVYNLDKNTKVENIEYHIKKTIFGK